MDAKNIFVTKIANYRYLVFLEPDSELPQSHLVSPRKSPL